LGEAYFHAFLGFYSSIFGSLLILKTPSKYSHAITATLLLGLLTALVGILVASSS